MFDKNITMRHEMKYLISTADMELLKRRLSVLLAPDPHQGEDGYTIRSLYLDTYGDRFLNENGAGLEARNKYRIRTYLREPDFFCMEEKTTIGSLKSKQSARLTEEQAGRLAQGGVLSLAEASVKPVLERVYLLERAERLRPRAIVEYDRFALIGNPGNIRITFDRRIRTSEQTDRFPDWNLQLLPILPDGIELLEVKYDGVLGGSVARVLETLDLQRISFSKYALCRDFLSNNGRIEDKFELRPRF